MTSPRPFVAAAAASVLAALFFVPSATASPGHDSTDSTAKTVTHSSSSTDSTVSNSSTGSTGSTADQSSGTAHATQTLGLADTGSIDTKPYVVGGAAFLVVGAGLILNASRRTRQTLAGV